jgi:acetyl-CoA C-acetyltransferase
MSAHTNQRVSIVDGARTPFLKIRSGPAPFTSVGLTVKCGRPLLARQPFDRTAFDMVLPARVKVIADCLSAVTTLGTSSPYTE